MPRARDFLERLRPVGAPGAAGPAGVPADRRAEITAELEPVFAALSDTEAEVQRFHQVRGEQAARQRDRIAQRVVDLLAGARREAEAERAAVAAQIRHRMDVEAADAQAAAQREADLIRRHAQERLGSRVAMVVQRARAELHDLAGATEQVDAGGAE